MDKIRTIFGGLFTAGATLSLGFLSFVGMYVLTPALIPCIISFILAVAYEHQIYGEGVDGALRRLFGRNYLAKAIVEKYLDELIEEKKFSDNLFLKDYKEQKEYIEKLQKYIAYLEEKSHEEIYRSTEWKKYHKQIHEKEHELEKAKERLQSLQNFFVNRMRLDHKSEKPTDMEKAVDALLEKDGCRAILRKEIFNKRMLIWGAMVLSLGVGASSCLATLSSMQAGFILLGFAVPAGPLVVASVLAACGYFFLTVQGVSDMIQDYNKKKGYFNRRDQESSFKYYARCTLFIVAAALGIIASFLTAFTWRMLVKDGAQIFGAAEKIADLLCNITIPMMIGSGIFFSSYNSIQSIDKTLRSDFKQIIIEAGRKVKRAWKEENWVQFFNPFRIVSQIISLCLNGLLLLGHISSVGVSSDNVDLDVISSKLPPVPAPVAAGICSTVEFGEDFNYLPDGHKHESKLLTALFVTAKIVTLLPLWLCLATMWDYAFSKQHDFKASCKKILTTKGALQEGQEAPELAKPERPDLSVNWRKQELRNTCKSIEERLQDQKTDVASKKLIAAQNIMGKVENIDNDDHTLKANKGQIEKLANDFKENRYSFWSKNVPASAEEFNNTLGVVFAAPAA